MSAARSALDPRAAPDVEQLVADAAARGAAGDPGGAVGLLTLALARAPTSAALWAFRGRMWRLAGHIDRAASDLLRSIRIDPGDPFAQAQLSWVDWVRGERAGAKARLRRVARRHPQYHWAPAYLAQQHMVSGQPRAAMRAIQRALALSPACVYTRRIWADLLANAGDPDRALAELDALAPVDGGPHIHAERALVLAHLGDLPGALTAIDRALALAAHHRHFWRDRAAFHILAGDHRDAVDDVERAIRVSHEREPHLAYRLAQLHHHLGNSVDVTRALHRVRAAHASPTDVARRAGRLDAPRWTPDVLLAKVGIMEPPGAPLA